MVPSRHTRLIECFRAVFPELAEEDLARATIDTVANWDSSNFFLLVQVIEESFGVRLPEAALAEIDSFAGFEDYLSANTALA